MSQNSVSRPYWQSFLFLPAVILFSLLMGLLTIPFLFFLPVNASAKTARFWCRTVLWMARIFGGLKADIKGLEHLQSGRGLIAARHQSAWETFQLFLLLPTPVFILKKSLMNIPVFGWFLNRLGMISIDRSQGASALRDMQRKAIKAAAAGRWIIIFPEGTRSKPDDPVRLHPGVLGLYDTLHTSIIPAVLDSGRFWQGFKLYPGTVTLRFFPPIPPGHARRDVRRNLQETLTCHPTSE